LNKIHNDVERNTTLV